MFKDNVSKKIFFALMSSPIVLFPFVFGATSLMFSWAMGGSKIPLFVGVCGMLASVGNFFTKLFLSGDNIAKEIMEAAEKKIMQELQKDLDNLAYLLSNDGDKRDDDLLADLREMYQKIKEKKGEKNDVVKVGLKLEIGEKIDALFHESIKSLKVSHDLLLQSKQTRRRSLKAEMLGRRDEILQEIECAVQRIGDSILHLETKKNSGSSIPGTEKLRNLSDELDDSIRIAKKVEERLRSHSDEVKIHE